MPRGHYRNSKYHLKEFFFQKFGQNQFEPTNQDQIKVKVSSLIMREHIYKTLVTSIIYTPLSPPFHIICQKLEKFELLGFFLRQATELFVKIPHIIYKYLSFQFFCLSVFPSKLFLQLVIFKYKNTYCCYIKTRNPPQRNKEWFINIPTNQSQIKFLLFSGFHRNRF